MFRLLNCYAQWKQSYMYNFVTLRRIAEHCIACVEYCVKLHITLRSETFLTAFQYKCWELSVNNLSTLNHVYVKRNTALMIWLTIVMRFVYKIRKMWCLVKFIIWMQLYEVYNERMTYLTSRHIYLQIFTTSMGIIFSSRFHHLNKVVCMSYLY
jgi:hypothetical protein